MRLYPLRAPTRATALVLSGTWLVAACGGPADNQLFASSSENTSVSGTSSTSGASVSMGGAATNSAGMNNGGTRAGASPMAGSGGNGAGGDDNSGPEIDMIDDMEDGDSAILEQRGRRGYWFTTTDETPGSYINPSTQNAFYMTDLTRPGSSSRKGAYVQGGGFLGWGAAAGFDFAYYGRVEAYDVSGATGLRFWARADTPVSVNVQFPNIDSHPAGDRCVDSGNPPEQACFSHWGKRVEFTSEWREVEVAWSELALPPGGRQVPSFDAENVYSVLFAVGTMTQFGIWIDDVALFD